MASLTSLTPPAPEAAARCRLHKRLLDKTTVDLLATAYPRLAEQLYAARLRLLIKRQLLSICHSAAPLQGATSPDWDAAVRAALSPPLQASVQPGAAGGSMLEHVRLLQLLVQHSAAWQAMQLLLQGGPSNAQRAPGAPHLEQSLSSDMAATACQLVGDASSQCCENRFGGKRARAGGGGRAQEEREEEEVVSSAAALPHARAQRAKRARGAARHH